MMRTAAVIGHPVSHSLSPDLFSFLAGLQAQKEFTYEAIDVPSAKLKEFIQQQRQMPERVGFNVTIPHKERLFDLLDNVSKEARTVGAVNVIEIKNSRWSGHNTDILGLQDSLLQSDADLDAQNVLILGAGGAARAAAFAVAVEGAKRVVICNRNQARAEVIVQDFKNIFSGTEFISADYSFDFAAENAKLVIQATPLGMSGIKTDDSDLRIFESLLNGVKSQQAFAFDLIYRPEETVFLKMAKRKGFKTITGLSMLIGQALATWEIWFSPITSRPEVFSSLTLFLRKKLAADL